MSLLRMLVKEKAKENLNSFESDQQTSTASTQITTNKDPSTGFPTQKKRVINVLLTLLPKYKIYGKYFRLGPLV